MATKKFKSNLVATTAVVAPVVPAPVLTAPMVPVYSPELFKEYEVEQYRVRFPGETAGYDDVTLFNVAMLPDEDQSDSDWAALFQKHQPTPEMSEMGGEWLATLAQGFAARVSPETEQAMDTAVTGKEDWQGGPIIVRAGLIRDFGDDLSGFAEPNSKSGNNPDRYKMAVTDNANKTAIRPTSFYLQFTRATPAGKLIVDEIALLKRANALDTVKTGIPAAILNMSADARDNRIIYLENRIKTMMAGYKKAMSLHFQCQRFDELAIKVDATGNVNADAALNVRHKQGTVGWSFIFDTDDEGNDTDEVVNSPTPIMIFARNGYETGTGDARPIKDQQKVSIGAFLKFNVATAIKNGSTYKALLKTVERAQPDKNKGKTPDTKTETVDQFIGRFVESYRFMNEMQQAADPAALAKLYAVLKTDRDGKDSGELTVAWVEMAHYMADVASEMQLNAKYTELQAKKSPLVMRKAS